MLSKSPFDTPMVSKMRAPSVDHPDDFDNLCCGLGRLKHKRIALGNRIGQPQRVLDSLRVG